MATPTQYSFSLLEIAQAILIQEKITEGRWMVGVNFGIQVGNLGSAPNNQVKPSASVMVEGFNISRVQDDSTPPKELEPLIIDASTLKRD